MAKAKLESLDGVPEALASEYEEKDGAFILRVDPVDGLELQNVTKLRNAFQGEKAHRQKLSERLAQFCDEDGNWLKDEDGNELSGEALLKVYKDNADLKSKLKDAKGVDIEALVKEGVDSFRVDLVKKHQTQIGERDSVIAELNSTIDELVINATVDKAISEAGGKPEQLRNTVLFHSNGRRAMRRRKTGDNAFVVEALDPAGNPRIGDEEGNSMTPEHVVAELKKSETWSQFFNGSGASGSGSSSSASKRTTVGGRVRTRADLKNAAEKTKFISEHGLQAFKDLPAGPAQ